MQNDSVRFCVIAFNVSIEDDGEVKLMVCKAYLSIVLYCASALLRTCYVKENKLIRLVAYRT